MTTIGQLFLINSTVSGNSSLGVPGVGGGVYNLVGSENHGRVYIFNSTVANNTAREKGGGIRIDLYAFAEFSNSIVAGNFSNSDGG